MLGCRQPPAEASRRGLGRAVLAAYGDAVVPQITEAIGRVVKNLVGSVVESDRIF